MAKKHFRAESKRLLDLMVNSIYTNKDIFLRELVSNASDAIDKVYYKTLTDKSLEFNREDFYIKINIDEEKRQLTIEDTGIGMTEDELNENLGVIAKSGSLDFKQNNQLEEDYDIIGQFGVGFYSAFMVADKIRVYTRSIDSKEGYLWTSEGEDGYTIDKINLEDRGTKIVLDIKESTDEENYDKYLEEIEIVNIIKKYSDYIRYPIKMELSKRRLKEGTEDEYEEYREEEVINSMVPLWRRNRNELKEEDYINFYQEKRFGFDKPLESIHMKVDGLLSFNALLFIPKERPYNFYTKDYEKGLELYSSGVMIKEKTAELIPDYFSFVKGVVDSEDLSLNISREILQQNRQLSLIAKNIEKKIKSELENIMKNKREEYEDFFKNFGMQIKYGLYDNFGRDSDKLKDLVIYPSSRGEMVSFKEYIEDAKEGQKYIYYAVGDSLERLKNMPQGEILKDKGYEILYLTEHIDEFAIKMLSKYDDYEFKSIMDDDLGIELEGKEELKESEEANKDLFKELEKKLESNVTKVKASNRLKDTPVCLSTEGDISLEMEKVLNQMPDGEKIKANRILEINIDHEVFKKLQDAFENDKEKFELLAKLLYDQALILEGLDIENPVEFTNNIWRLM